jgi:regulator of replication initiation timing
MSETTPTPAPQKKSNMASIIAIAVLSIIIILQFVKIYFDTKEEQILRAEKATTEEELATTMQRLNEIKLELNEKITEIEKLGGDVSELQKAKQEVESELKRTRRANGQIIKELKDRVEGYEVLLKQKDEEIEKLKSVNKELMTENVTLKTEKNTLGDSISQLKQTKAELASKVAIASQLKAENIRIVSVNERGRERESPFKKSQAAKIKIDFNLAENNVAPIGGKKIMIRVIDQNGQVLFDVARGSGTFMYNGKEEFYTASQEILFDNTKQKLSYFYEKGSEYTAGTYMLEVYCDDYKMGSGKFEIK